MKRGLAVQRRLALGLSHLLFRTPCLLRSPYHPALLRLSSTLFRLAINPSAAGQPRANAPPWIFSKPPPAFGDRALTGVYMHHPLMLLIFLAIVSSVAVLNQVRTLVAHLWENDGEPLSVTAQFLDSVNVPPPGVLASIWAPVGLRYHALHHLLPSVPYHALGEAHRRLTAQLTPDSAYHRASYDGLADWSHAGAQHVYAELNNDSIVTHRIEKAVVKLSEKLEREGLEPSPKTGRLCLHRATAALAVRTNLRVRRRSWVTHSQPKWALLRKGESCLENLLALIGTKRILIRRKDLRRGAYT